MADTTFTTEGTIFDKNTRTVQGRKDPSQTYNFSSFKLEMKSRYNDKEFTEIPEFQCGKGVNIDDYEIGDYISVRFVLKGKKISDTFYKTELSAIYLKHADLSSSKDNKKADSFGTFKPPKPLMADVPPVPESGEQEDFDQLPF